MLLIWGPGRIAFYNDAFHLAFGGNSGGPALPGNDVEKNFPELWQSIAPFVMQVMEDGKAISQQELLPTLRRNGGLENTYKKADYTPVRDEAGLPRGVLALFSEMTADSTRYRNIVESAKGPIMIFKGEELIIEEANSATLALWQTDRSVIGRPFLEVKPEFRHQTFPDLIRGVLRTGQPYKGYEYPAVFARVNDIEELRYFNFEYTPYTEPNGEISGVVILAIDVTDQVLGKKQLSIAEEEMQVAIQAANLGYWNLDPVRKTFKCNARTRALFALPDEEDVNLAHAIRNIHPDDRQHVIAAIEAALAFENNGYYDCEYRVVHPENGACFVVKAIGRAYRDSAGNVVRLSGTVQDFTSSKAAEEALRQQVQFTESILLANPALTYIYDIERKVFTFISPQVEQIVGYTREEALALGSHFLHSVLAPEAGRAVQRHLSELAADGQNGLYNLECQVRHRHGRMIWICDRCRVFERNEAGKPLKILGIAADITEQKNLELLLTSRFDELDTVYRTAPVGLCLINRDLLFIRVNERLAEINGVPAAEHVGRSIFEVVPDLAAQAAPLLRSIFETGEPLIDIEIKGETKAKPGEQRIWTESWHPVHNAGGEIIAVSVVAEEITEQRKALEVLRASEARFQNLVRDTSAAIIVLTGPEMNVEIVNEAFGRLIGLKPEELRGKPLFTLIPDAEAYYRPLLEGVYRTGEPLELFESPYSVVTHGKTFEGFLHVVYQPYRGDGNETLGVMAILQDVTESVKARQAVESSEARFRSLIEESPVATCLMMGRDLRVELANDIMLRYWGKDASVIGKPLADALPELAGQPFLKILDEVFTSGERFDAVQTPAELAINGALNRYYFDFTYKPLFDSEGKVYAILNTAIDVTGAVKAKQKLEESEKRYRRILESNIAGVLFWDMDKGITDANDAFLNMIGYTRDELAGGLHWQKITPEEWKQKDDESIAELLASGKSAPFEKQYFRKTGGVVDVLLANTAFEDTANRQGVSFVLDITEQKKAEIALRESESRFRSLADEAPAFIFLANADARIEYINDTWIRFTGLPKDEALGQGWATITHPDDLQRSFDIYNHAFATHTAYQYEMQQRGGDGEYHWILWRGIPRFLPDGSFLGILGFGFDITERKKSEEALKASEDLFRSFGDNIHNLAWIADGEGWIYWYNQRWYDYTGTDYDEMQGWGWEKVHHPDHIERVLTFVREAWKKGEPWELTFPLRSAGGDYQWFLTRAVPILDEKGAVGRWIGTNTNIHEQKLLSDQLEELVLERTLELSQSKAFLQSVLNSAQTTITTFEAVREADGRISDFRLTYVNSDIIDDRGQPTGNLVGKTCREVFPHIFSSGEFARFVSCVETGQVVQYETRYERAGNGTTWYYVSLAKMGDGLTATSLNMTKEKEATEQLSVLNRELDDRNRQLQRSNEDLQQFAHVASHDLKEPVRKIRTFSSRLKDEFGSLLPEKGRSYLSRIEKGADRMYDMIDGVLLYSSLDALQQTKEEVSLRDVLDTIQSDLEIVIAEKGASIEVGSLPTVEGVPILIYQLFYNLVNNALKFAKEDRALRIRVHSQESTVQQTESSGSNSAGKRFTEVMVQDNGIGFAQEAAERIFQTFTRLHAKDRYEGTGLGLSLCRKIAERHGGTIRAEGKPGVGATFYVVLPIFN
ncbi:hypothetical protein GCM10023184_29090 [Flaviaesturariibacter amylovorans]|uniref:histidine kinase n=2 Tax=Flaviaesturariibacter amylovorans TaxID=1084520 RepID=A0ABP8H5N0_9BACT